MDNPLCQECNPWMSPTSIQGESSSAVWSDGLDYASSMGARLTIIKILHNCGEDCEAIWFFDLDHLGSSRSTDKNNHTVLFDEEVKGWIKIRSCCKQICRIALRLTKTVIERVPRRVEFHGHFNERPINSRLCLEFYRCVVQPIEVIEIVRHYIWSWMCGAGVIRSMSSMCRRNWCLRCQHGLSEVTEGKLTNSVGTSPVHTNLPVLRNSWLSQTGGTCAQLLGQEKLRCARRFPVDRFE